MDIFDKILSSQASRICIIAAPGSGKTKRGLIPKVVQILEEPSTDPRAVLLLTFSRLSAKDLKDRVSNFEKKPIAATVHSLCLAFLLSENNHGMRKRVESIVLDFEKDALISDLKLIFPSENKRDLRRMLDEFGAGWATQPHDDVFEKTEKEKVFKAAVVNWLSEHQAAMMEEIVYAAVELARQLKTSDFISTPKYIFVDEYQDLNRLEQEFIELLAEDSELLFLVGDPDQSIYSFKYAYPHGIIEYLERPGVDGFSSNKTGRCPKKIVEVANQLLRQGEPERQEYLESIREDEGEVNFIQRDNQNEEFSYVLESISEKIRSGVSPSEIFVLTPKKLLGVNFTEYANKNREAHGVSYQFKFDSKTEFSPLEKERLLLFGLTVNPDSLLHIRGYLGLGIADTRANEINRLKKKYGNLKTVLDKATYEDFPKSQTRTIALIDRIVQLKVFLEQIKDGKTLEVLIDELFPENDPETRQIRSIVDLLREDEDTIETLYFKLIDYMRSVPTSPDDIRVMTLMGSKGLDADHVYIIGCNGGNIPGSNRSSNLTEHEHKQEQRRLLFVGVTRAKQSLTISWARQILFSQSRQQHTQGLRTLRQKGGPTQMVLPISEFFQDLNGIEWK